MYQGPSEQPATELQEPAKETAPPQKPPIASTPWKRGIFGFAAIIAWLGILTCGISIGTTTIMHRLDPDNPVNQPPTWDQALKLWQLERDSKLPGIEVSRLATLTRAEAGEILLAATELESAMTPQTLGKPDTTAADAKKNGPQTSAEGTLSMPASAADVAKFSWPAPQLKAGLKELFTVFFCNTIVNLAMLSCLASLIGGLYYSAMSPNTDHDSRRGAEWYLMNMVQGFVIYLAVIAGLIVLGDAPVENVSAEKYVKLAGLVSVLSFWAGYTPEEFFLKILGGAMNRFGGNNPAPNSAGTAAAPATNS